MEFQTIILAAGKGTRMNSTLPKVLVGLRGKPLIQHILDSVNGLSVNKPVIVVGYKYELIQSYLGPNFIYAFQEGQLGTGHAVMSAKPKIDSENVLVLYGDMPFIRPESIKKLLELHQNNKSNFSMFTSVVSDFEGKYASLMAYGRIIRDDKGQIVMNREFIDAAPEEKQVKEINPSFYVFNTKWLWHNLDRVQKNKHGEYYLTDLVEIAIKNKDTIVTVPLDPEEALGINTPEQLKMAEQMTKTAE